MKLLFPAVFLGAAALCQNPVTSQNVVSFHLPESIKAKSGAAVTVPLSMHVNAGFHVNSNRPSDPYFIPLSLSWTAGNLRSPEVVYPKPQLETLGFSTMPVSVFTGDFEIVTKFKAGSTTGAASVSGKLHFQACNDTMCLAPKTVNLTLPVEIVK